MMENYFFETSEKQESKKLYLLVIYDIIDNKRRLKFAKAMEGLRSIRDGNNFDISGFVGGLFGGQNIQEALSSVKQDIIDAGNALQSFTGIPDIPDGVGDKLKKIADSLKSIGDAMGVPTEFCIREKLQKHPVVKMIGYGQHDVPAGCYSDDTCMELALIDSFNNKNCFDYEDIMTNFYC